MLRQPCRSLIDVMTMTTTALMCDHYDESLKDGFVTFGPLRGISLSEVQRKMKKNSVFAFEDGCEVMQNARSQGETTLTVVSDWVTGYFLDEEGAEASSSDIENFLLDILQPGQEISIEGSYTDGMGGTIVNQARYRRVDDQIISDIERNLFSRDGSRTELQVTTDLHEHEIALFSKESGNIVSLAAFRRTRVV